MECTHAILWTVKENNNPKGGSPNELHTFPPHTLHLWSGQYSGSPEPALRLQLDVYKRQEQQSRYRTAIADLESRIAAASTAERVKLNKQLKKLQDQDAELRIYEEKIHHLADQMISIDLDDGIKVNYAKFQDVLAKIKWGRGQHEI